jgi:hypothetical protein
MTDRQRENITMAWLRTFGWLLRACPTLVVIAATHSRIDTRRYLLEKPEAGMLTNGHPDLLDGFH